MVIGGLRKYANTSKLAAIYLLLALIFIYQVTRIIAVSTSLVPKIYKILYDEVNYSTDLSRSNAIQSLQRETSMVIGNGIVALVGIAVTCFFATKKTLDGESRWPYLVVFFLTLFFLYMSAYYEANILNSVSNMNAEFIAIFNESRTCAIAYISLFVISYNNDYDPDLDPTLLNASVAAQ